MVERHRLAACCVIILRTIQFAEPPLYPGEALQVLLERVATGLAH